MKITSDQINFALRIIDYNIKANDFIETPITRPIDEKLEKRLKEEREKIVIVMMTKFKEPNFPELLSDVNTRRKIKLDYSTIIQKLKIAEPDQDKQIGI